MRLFSKLDSAYTWLLYGGIFLGIVLRFWSLDLIEFKGDEFAHLEGAYKNLQAPFSVNTIHGGIGVPHPAMTLYILMIPVSLSLNPIFVSGFVALVNCLGLYALYRLLTLCSHKKLALLTTAVFAMSPWLIIFSRKIWNPDFIVPFQLCFLWIFFSLQKDYRSWKVYLAAVLLACYTQMHGGTWFTLPGLVAYLLLFRIKFRWRDACAALLIIFLLYAPYVSHHLGTGFEAFGQFFSSRSEGSLIPEISNLKSNVAWLLAIASGLRFDYLLGSRGYTVLQSLLPTALLTPIQITVVILMAFMLVYWILQITRRALKKREISLQQRLIIYCLLHIMSLQLVFYILRTPMYPHYALIGSPAVLLLFVFGMRAVAQVQASRIVSQLVITCLLISNLVFMLGFFEVLRVHHESLDGDYGTPYTFAREQWLDDFTRLQN